MTRAVYRDRDSYQQWLASARKVGYRAGLSYPDNAPPSLVLTIARDLPSPRGVPPPQIVVCHRITRASEVVLWRDAVAAELRRMRREMRFSLAAIRGGEAWRSLADSALRGARALESFANAFVSMPLPMLAVDVCCERAVPPARICPECADSQPAPQVD